MATNIDINNNSSSDTSSKAVVVSHWTDLWDKEEHRRDFLIFRLNDETTVAYTIFMIMFVGFIVYTAGSDIYLHYHTSLAIPMLVSVVAALMSIVALTCVKLNRRYKDAQQLRQNEEEINLRLHQQPNEEQRRPALISLEKVEPQQEELDRSEDDVQRTQSRLKSMQQKWKATRRSSYRIKKRHTYHQTISDFELFLENISFFLLVSCFNLYVVMCVILYEQYHIDYELMNAHSLPDNLVFASLMFPMVLYMVLKGVHFSFTFIALSFSLILAFSMIVIYNFHRSWSRTTLSILFAVFALSEYHRQCWSSYQTNKKLQESVDENARLAEEIKSNELRHMIGNVAHDLKTPLSSFVSGMEVIRTEATELLNDVGLQTLKTRSSFNLTAVKDKLSTIIEVAENVANTNAFMIMTINRCIDYNKTLFGVKLTAKTDTFVLSESIDFVLNCLKCSADTVAIDCLYVAQELHYGHVKIRSDKQWLQENLMCLIGNALKYSAKRTSVKLLVDVVDKQAIDIIGFKTNEVMETLPNFSRVPSSSVRQTSWRIGFPAPPKKSRVYDLEFSRSSDGCDGEAFNSKKSSLEKFLRIEVIDTGPGIDNHLCEKLFQEPAQAARINGGTGLGLYSLSKRVEALGGNYGIMNRDDGTNGSNIWFAVPYHFISKPVNETPPLVGQLPMYLAKSGPPFVSSTRASFELGGGSSARTKLLGVSEEELPSVEDKSMMMRCDSNSEKPSVTESTGFSSEKSYVFSVPMIDEYYYSDANRSMMNESQQPREEEMRRVLVVDDSPPIVKMTSLALRKKGFVVTSADNGLEAVRIFREEIGNFPNRSPFDIVLMDFQMPVMGGIEAIREIRLIEQQLVSAASLQHKCYIVGFSAKSDEYQIEEAYSNGMDGFLTKPFTVPSFCSILPSLTHNY